MNKTLFIVLDTYYMEDIRSIEATKEKNGTVFSHKDFGQRPYRRNIYTSLRITDLDYPGNATQVVLVKFTSPFEVFSGNGGDFCRNDILYMGSEGGQALLKRYCNNNKPELDVWTPHITDTKSFIFQFYSSNRGLRVSEQTQSYGFQLEYFGKLTLIISQCLRLENRAERKFQAVEVYIVFTQAFGLKNYNFKY